MREMTLREVQMMTLDIAKNVHEFCTRNNITYYLAYGSLIGALRHKGFIPWDDDMDLLMPRPDYERFCKEYKSEKGFKVISRITNKECYVPYARVCEMKRTYVHEDNIPWCNEDTGVWIDIFPLDGAEEDFDIFKKRVNKIFNLNNYCFKWRNSKVPTSMVHGLYSKLKLVVKKILFSHYDPIDKYIRLLKKIELGRTTKCMNLTAPQYKEREYFNISDFESTVNVIFEGFKFKTMNGYDIFLKSPYGNYMAMPPVEKRQNHSFHKNYWRQ